MIKILIPIFLLLGSCAKHGDETKTVNLSDNASLKSELSVFNEVDETRKKLFTVGIGELSNWRDDEMGGFVSLSNYYTFGKDNLNNLAYYLEGNSADHISSIKIVLNINNKVEKSEALQKLSDVTRNTYMALNLPAPEALNESIVTEHPVVIESDGFTSELKFEQSKIQTWMVIIKSREL